MNLVVQMFFSFHLMHQIEGLVQLFYQYFHKSLKRHLELIKVVDIIKTSRLKILKKKLDVTQILKLSPLVSPNDLALDYNIFVTMLYYILMISFHM